MDRLDGFNYHDPSTDFKKEDGWQYAPTHMFFDIKHDFRHKAQLVVGGKIIDSTGHSTYSSTVQDISIRLMLLIAVANNLGMMAGDIGNAFCTAPCAENMVSGRR